MNKAELQHMLPGNQVMSDEADLLNKIAYRTRLLNEHWWKNPATGEKKVRNQPEQMMLMVSEIAEAMEGLRKGLTDSKLPQFSNEVVEFADLYIRLMDYVGEYHPDFGQAVVEKRRFNGTRADHTDAARLAPGGKKF